MSEKWTEADHEQAMAALLQIAIIKLNGRTFTKTGQDARSVTFTADGLPWKRQFTAYPIGRGSVPSDPQAVGYRLMSSNGGTIAGFVIDGGDVVFPPEMWL